MKRDAEGFLCNLADWNSEVAGIIATEEGITLTDAHHEVIHALRDF